jgi:hypothetical protein
VSAICAARTAAGPATIAGRSSDLQIEYSVISRGIEGARRRDRLQEALGAAARERYNPGQMAHLDSEMG